MDLLRVFAWKEEEVFSKVAGLILEEPSITDGKDYAYWDRQSPIIIQAHIDVVCSGFKGQEWDKENKEWKKRSEVGKLELLKCRNIITAKVGILGGDDRAGVLACIAINNTCKKDKIPMPSILLTNGEERGGFGMKEFIKVTVIELFAPVNLIIGMDRRGCSEYVTYIDPDREVRDYIESFGFVKSYGSYSDSKDLSRATNIPHVNLSIGYYDNHSSKEVVHIDEMLLTAKRVCDILKDPIDKRYKIEEEKIHKYIGGHYDFTEKYLIPGKDNADTKKSISATNRRRKRCEMLRETNKFPSLVIYYPYLDYLLTDKDIRAGFHVVSSAGEGDKTLEEWSYLFRENSIDQISEIWKKEFGVLEKLYIKSSAVNKFYLAVKYDSYDLVTAKSACSCESAETKTKAAEVDRLVNLELSKDGEYEYSKKAKEAAEERAAFIAEYTGETVLEVLAREAQEDAEDEVNICEAAIDGKGISDDFVSVHGYCGKYSSGDCDGSCHGNRHYCEDPEIKKYGDHQGYFGCL
uniref:Peptidase n=1 Tax=viral metagenome TaxID=1070528 RepID=A0A6H1ZH62_9ZZZZ